MRVQQWKACAFITFPLCYVPVLGQWPVTPTSVNASNSFLMSWMYHVTSDQTVSDLIGAFEIITALLLLGSFWNNKIGRIAGYAGIIIFLTAISFLFTTPGIWKAVEGVPTTDFFVVKDLAFLAIMFLVVGEHSTNEIHKQI